MTDNNSDDKLDEIKEILSELKTQVESSNRLMFALLMLNIVLGTLELCAQ